MLPKILIIFIHLFSIKTVFTKAVYSAAPTYAYSSTAVPSAKTYSATAMLSPSASLSTSTPTALTSVPASSSVVPLTASPASLIPTSSSLLASTVASSSPASNIPVLSIPVSPLSEAKAYFLPGPISDPKVTILSDMPSVVEGNPRLTPNHNIIELNRASDPGFIEVIGKFCDAKNTNLQGDVHKPVLPAVRENTVSSSAVKRLSMACSDNEPILPADSLPYLQKQQVVCPGISKTDFVLLPPEAGKGKTNNPIEFEGLLDSFLTYLAV